MNSQINTDVTILTECIPRRKTVLHNQHFPHCYLAATLGCIFHSNMLLPMLRHDKCQKFDPSRNIHLQILPECAAEKALPLLASWSPGSLPCAHAGQVPPWRGFWTRIDTNNTLPSWGNLFKLGNFTHAW